jgi:glycosyltransferase involved in cell wall biosynthesis
MRIGVIYNFAEHKGGGDYVMLNILEALSDAGFGLHLLTSNPAGIKEAAKLFDKDTSINGLEIRGYRKLPFLPHPYSVAYIARKVRKKYELFLVADDVPKELAGDVVCYVHYPHAARLALSSLVAGRYNRGVKGRMAWSLHKALFPRFFYLDCVPHKIMILANSTLTKDHVSRTLKPKLISVLFPPVESRRILKLFEMSEVEKEDVGVFVGKFIPEKGIEDIIRVARLIKNHLSLKFRIIGFCNDKAFLNRILSMIKIYGVEDIVQVFPNASRENIIDEFIKAKFVIHPASYEPFGISVVEGMAAACVPIVRRGFNGPWVDITMNGKYGFGFKNVYELAEVLEEAMNEYNEFRHEAVISRALDFDEENFKINFLHAIKPFLAS